MYTYKCCNHPCSCKVLVSIQPFSNLGNLLVRMITLFARRISAKHFLRCKSQSRLCDFRCLSTTDDANAKYMDVLIVGGGAVGCALAHALNRFLPNLKVGLLEARDAPKMAPNSEILHPRSYALSPASLQLLGAPTTLLRDSSASASSESALY